MKKPKSVEVITHYTKGNLGGDYYEVEVKVDGKTAVTYGDYYHDKGDEKSEAFVEGLEFAFGESLKVKKTDLDDIDDGSGEDEES